MDVEFLLLLMYEWNNELDCLLKGDSVPRPLMKLDWKRLGLPVAVADWITSLDDEGLTFPATPHVLLNQQTCRPRTAPSY